MNDRLTPTQRLSMWLALPALALLCAQHPAQDLWFVEADSGTFSVRSLPAGAVTPVTLYSNTGGFEDLCADAFGNVFTLEENGIGGWQVVRIDQSGATTVMSSTGSSGEYWQLAYYGGFLYIADDNDQVLRLPADAVSGTPTVMAVSPFEIDDLAAGDGGFVYMIGCTASGYTLAEISPGGTVRPLSITLATQYGYVATSCGRLFVTDDNGSATLIRPMNDPMQANPVLDSPMYSDPTGNMGEIEADCTGNVFAPFDSWMISGVPAIVRIDSTSVATALFTGQSGQSFQSVAVNDPSEFRVHVTTEGNFGVRVAITGIPSGTGWGGLIPSGNTSASLGAGPFYGITRDALTVSLLAPPVVPTPGGPFLWTYPSAGLFPEVPWVLPPGTLNILQGTSMDVRGFALGPGIGAPGYELSNVLRLNW